MNTALRSSFEHPPVFEDLGKIAAKLVYYNYEWRYLTLVMIQTAHMLIPLQAFLLEYKQSVVIKMGKFIAYNSPVRQFVIFGEDSKEIIGVLQWLNNCNYDNSGKYVIVCSATDYEDCDEKEVFEVLSDYNMVNVLFLRADTDNTSLTFTYEKIVPGECKNKVPDVIDDLYIGCSDDECFKFKFLPKYRNFYKCPFVVSTFEQPPFMHLEEKNKMSGEDGDLVNLITSYLNASLVVKVPEDEYWGRYENNNWTGSLGDVYNGRVDISVCSQPVTASKNGNFQISFVYNSMDIVWSARLPTLQPAYEKLLHPFKLLTRVVLFLVFMSIVIISTFIRTSLWSRIRRSFNIGPPKSSLMFYSWALFLGVPILQFPSNRHVLGIIITWIWFCFIMRSCYQAALINSLKRHDLEDYMESFKKVLENKYPYGGHSSLRDYYASDAHIYKDWINLRLTDVDEKLDQISHGMSDFVVANNKEVVKDYMYRSNGSYSIQIIPEKIVNSPTVMYFKRHSPLVARVNEILSRSVEAGLPQLAQKRYTKNFFQYSNEDKTSPLTFEHITACVYVLVFGWSLSVIFFVVEVYFGKYK